MRRDDQDNDNDNDKNKDIEKNEIANPTAPVGSTYTNGGFVVPPVPSGTYSIYLYPSKSIISLFGRYIPYLTSFWLICNT